MGVWTGSIWFRICTGKRGNEYSGSMKCGEEIMKRIYRIRVFEATVSFSESNTACNPSI